MVSSERFWSNNGRLPSTEGNKVPPGRSCVHWLMSVTTRAKVLRGCLVGSHPSIPPVSCPICPPASRPDNHLLTVGVIYAPYLSFANTMTSWKRNKCLSLVLEPSVTWTHSSSSSSPFSLVRPRTKGLCSAVTQQEASSLKKGGGSEGYEDTFPLWTTGYGCRQNIRLASSECTTRE